MARREPYSVVLAPAVRRELRRLPESIRGEFKTILASLGKEPRPQGCRKVQGQVRAFRIRVGRYRIIYDVFDDRRLVDVLQVVRRPETTYRRLR